MLFLFILGGVPVLSLPVLGAISESCWASTREGLSPRRPPLSRSLPVCITPFKNVPTVNTIFVVLKVSPHSVSTPHNCPCFVRTLEAAPSKTVSSLCWFSCCCIADLYKRRSACARVACTALPLLELSVFRCMPAKSAALAINPPRASISFARWPLPTPPIAGLQLICPMVFLLCVNKRVLCPILHKTAAASVPACPPPTTIASNVFVVVLNLLTNTKTIKYRV